MRVALERMVASQALAHENSHRPPVDGLRVGPPQKHLRLGVKATPSLYSHVLFRPAVAVATELADRFILVQLDVVVARETKVRQLDVPVRSEKHILRLQVSLPLRMLHIHYKDDAHGVEMLQSQDDFRHIQSRSLFREDAEAGQVCE